MIAARGISRSAIAPLFAALSLVLFAPGIVSGKVPAFRDLLVLTLPLRSFARDAIGSGALPLWTDDLFFGAPFLANYQSAVLYPPSALLYCMPLAAGFSLFLAFHVLLAGWGMARYLERHARAGPGEAVFGGLVFCLGGFLFSLISLTNQLVVAAWMPWALTAAEELVVTRSHRAFLQLTLILALQSLAGAPEALLLTLALIGARLARELWRRRAELTHCLLVGAAVLLAAALAAVQLLPTAEYALETDRAAGLPLATVTAESIAPRSLLQLVVPHTFEDGGPGFVPEGSVPLFWSLYIGIVPLALAAAQLARRPLGLWPLVFIGALLFSFGSHTPLFALLHGVAPRLVGAFRFPGKFFLVCHFALALFAARGAAAAGERGASATALGLLAALGGLAIAIAVGSSLAPKFVLEGFGYSLPPTLGESAEAVLAARLGLISLRGAILCFLAAGVLWLFRRERISRGSLLAGISVLTAVDLYSVHEPSLVFTDWRSLRLSGAARAEAVAPGERLFHYCTASPGCLPDGAPGLGPWNGFLRPGENAEQRARVLWAALVPDAPMVYGRGAVAGSDGFSTRQQQDFFRALALVPRERAIHLLRSLGVSRVIGPEPLGPLAGLTDPVEDQETATWHYSLSQRAPRSYLAERVLAAPDTTTALARLAEPGFRSGRDAVLVGSAEGSEADGGEIRNLVIGRAVIRADVVLPGRGLWVVTDTWFPGWEATIDGESAEILRVNGIHRGVSVPAGRHQLEMRYRPRPLRMGVMVSAGALAAWLVGALVASRRRRRSARTASRRAAVA